VDFMAPGKRRSRKSKKKAFVKFELTLSGLLGLGVVCFCVFLWMFLLGIWSGQSLAPPAKYRPAGIGKGLSDTLKPKAQIKEDSGPGEQAVVAPVTGAAKKELSAIAKKKMVPRKSRPAPEPEEDPAFFAVQVGAFKDDKLAVKEVAVWEKKGYNSFSRPPTGDDDTYTRVYVGRFDSLDRARDKAGLIGRAEKIKPFVVLVPGE